MGSELVKPHHLGRRAVVYVRQSSLHQVATNRESLRLQYALRQRARELGWREADVDVIDADLGLSGASVTHRQGFKDLVARVTLGEVGLILSTEVTRLARNCSDWYPLLDVCGHRGCLIADRDGVYDPRTADGRLLLGLKGTISELELHTIRCRLTAGLLAKAARGELALQLPVGLARDPSGVVTKDVDLEVQARIALVFATFLQVRTAMAVVRTLQARGLTLPRRDRHGGTSWRPATLMAVVGMLRNPAYGGAFVYGRTRLGSPTADRKPAQVRQPEEGWRFVVKDRYPAYIDWPTFAKIQAMLDDNRAEYVRAKGRGIPRDGAALLHGIAWCGECGHKMVVRYKGGSQYVCNHLRQQHGAPVCQCLRAAPIDARVAATFLEAVAPAEIAAWARARKAQRRADEAFRRAEEQQVERLRYRAALAERQFDRVDPDNRLVAAELERRWEAALGELRRAEEALAQRTSAAEADAAPEPLDPRLRARVIALGGRLPELWADPAVGREHKKALLRCLIDKVVMRRAARDRAAVRVVWRGGAATDLEVVMAVNALAALPRVAEMEARVLELARAGGRDEEIARTLATEGHHSPWRGAEVLPSTVRGIRLKHGIKVIPRQTRWPRRAGWLTVADVACRLRVSADWLRGQIRRGAIRTTREASGRCMFPDTADALEALRRLRVRVVEHVDLTHDAHQPAGYHHA
jgi:DNA invertase Pin-like site-specific DNA recombinase